MDHMKWRSTPCGVTPNILFHVYRGNCVANFGLAQLGGRATVEPTRFGHPPCGQLSGVRSTPRAPHPQCSMNRGNPCGLRGQCPVGSGLPGLDCDRLVPCPTLASVAAPAKTAGLVSWHIPGHGYPFRTTTASTARDRRLAEQAELGPPRRDPPLVIRPHRQGHHEEHQCHHTTAYRFMASSPFPGVLAYVGTYRQRS